MKTEHLHDLWASPDNARLTSKQFSFRLPVHIAAKIAALCEIYPQKNRTQIVADLLTSAIDDLEKNLPESLGQELEIEMQAEQQQLACDEGFAYEPLHYLGGPRGRFRETANQHYMELEAELGNKEPVPLYPALYFTESSFKKRK